MERVVGELELELSCGTLFYASLPELIEAAARAGYRWISVYPSLHQSAGLSDAGLRRRLSDAGVGVSVVEGLSGGLPGTPKGEALIPYRNYHGRDVTPGLMMPATSFFATADALGAKAVTMTHFAGDPATPFADLAEGSRSLCEGAAKHGLRMVVEFLPGTGIADIDTAARLIDAVALSNFDLILDTRHLARTGGTIEHVARHAAKVGVIQLSDLSWADRDNPDRLIPGEGDLPLAEMVRPVLAARPEVPIGVEIFSKAIQAMPPLDAAILCAESLRALPLPGLALDRVEA